ncbi:MAG: sulfotransferase family protein [Myxococcota bacterium]
MIRPALPPALRFVNALGDTARWMGMVRDTLAPDALVEEACRVAGLTDLGDPSFRPALETLLRSCEEDANLHFIGRRHMRDLVVRALVTRLRMVDAVRRAPDVALTAPPLLVCGLPRSGTTFLHRLLAEADAARALLLWELMDPLPGEGPDTRRADVDARMARLRRFAPANLDAQHLMRADLPDECGHLLKPTFLSSLYWMAPVTGYLAWYPHHDARPAYRDYRALLGLLQTDPSHRYVLKDPFHAMNLPALFAAIPNARVVQTHRAPSEVVPSLHKLSLTTQAVLTDGVDPARVVEANTTWLQTVATRSVEDRAKVPAGQVLDIDYRELLVDPVGAARRVHAHFGLPWSEGLEARLTAFVANNGQRRHGDNPYSPEDFGQTAAGIDARFEAYRARFL